MDGKSDNPLGRYLSDYSARTTQLPVSLNRTSKHGRRSGFHHAVT